MISKSCNLICMFIGTPSTWEYMHNKSNHCMFIGTPSTWEYMHKSKLLPRIFTNYKLRANKNIFADLKKIRAYYLSVAKTV